MMLRLLAGFGISAFFLLLLYAFHQYQAHDRTGPLRVVLGIFMATGTVVMDWLRGLPLLFHGTAMALWALHYWVGWYLPRRLSRPFVRHLWRGTVMGVVWGLALPPWDNLWWPAVAMKVLLGVLTFAGLSLWDTHRRELKPWPRRQRQWLALGVLLWVWCANGYLATAIDPGRAAASASMFVIRYLSWSRPGVALHRDVDGRTPLGISIASGRHDVVRYWARYLDYRVNGSGDTALCQAVRNGDACMAELLLQLGADANCQNSFNRTPLHLAAAGGQGELVTLLLARGADPQAKDRNGWTPARWASAFGHDALAQRLGFAPSPPPAR